MNPMLKIIIPIAIGIFVIISSVVITVAITQSNKTRLFVFELRTIKLNIEFYIQIMEVRQQHQVSSHIVKL